MDGRTIHERSERDVEPIEPEAEGRLEAATAAWQAWLVAAGAVLVAGYFLVTEGIWPNTAETFYALIFAGVAVAALAYGVRVVHERTSPF